MIRAWCREAELPSWSMLALAQHLKMDCVRPTELTNMLMAWYKAERVLPAAEREQKVWIGPGFGMSRG